MPIKLSLDIFADFTALLIRRWTTLSYCISMDATLMRGFREHGRYFSPATPYPSVSTCEVILPEN